MRLFVSILWLFLSLFFPSNQGYSSVSGMRKLIVFHSPACHRCIEAKNEVMPEIENEFKGKILIEYRDIADIENYKLMLSLKETYQAKDLGDLPVFFLDGHFLSSEGELKNKLKAFILQAISAPLSTQAQSPIDLISRFKAFKPLAVISAGLIDGINPCAFTVMVFFISFLALQEYRKRELALIGLSFTFAVFLTYILLGLGVFGFLYRLKNFWLLTKVFNISIGIFSIILGIFALYDFFRFKKTKKTEGLILQLPTLIKKRIHSVIGLHYRRAKAQEGKQLLRAPISRLVLSALITGFLVSLLEAVCTGQVYLPTITFVLKTTPLKLPALGYLLLYNLMFILPLLIIFLFSLWGVSSEQFSKFLKQRLLLIKMLMAVLFFGLGIFLLWRP